MQAIRHVGTGAGVSPVPVFILTDAGRALGLDFRAETAEDVAFLRRLYVSMRWDELASLDWIDAEKVAFLEQQFIAQRTHYFKVYGDAEFLIVEHDGQPVGRICIFRNKRDIRVVDVGLLPEFRNRGFGTALFQALFAEGEATSHTVSVHVEIFNPAKQLYERLGFQEIGEAGPYRLMEWRPAGTAA